MDSVQIVETGRNSRFRDAETRRDEIRLFNNISTQQFFEAPQSQFLLEEYFHVMEQWNTGRLSVLRYALAVIGPGNKWEAEARGFARDYDDWYVNCLRNP